nr:UBN2 domain-containing protein [Tanacetum cinerariifolium]
MKVEDSIIVTFDESPPPTKLSPLVDDDIAEEEAIKRNTKVVNNNEENDSIEVDENMNIKEFKNHPLDQVIENLNQRTLRSSGWKIPNQPRRQCHEINLTKDDEADSVDSSKYRAMIGNQEKKRSHSDKGVIRKRAYVTAIEESKDLSSLALDELIGNLKLHEVFLEKDSEIYRGKKERFKSIALKAKKESSDDETLTSKSDEEEYSMVVRNFKKFFRRKGKIVRQPREEKKSFR